MMATFSYARSGSACRQQTVAVSTAADSVLFLLSIGRSNGFANQSDFVYPVGGFSLSMSGFSLSL